LFADLCSLYWSRLGELPYALALQKLCNGNKDAMKELLEHDIFGVIDGQIVIEFLDEQLQDRGQTSEKRREAAQKRWSDANAMQLESKSNANRKEKKRKKEKRIEEPRPLRALPFLGVEFLNAWDEWETYRKQLNKKLTDSTAKKQIEFLGRAPNEEIAIAIINQSIKNGWIGLFEIKNNGSGKIGTKQQQTINTALSVAEHYSDILGKRADG